MSILNGLPSHHRPQEGHCIARLASSVVLIAAFMTPRAWAQNALFAPGRLAATGGITSVDGSAGGGINPWAVIAGEETNDQIGATAAYTYVNLPNYRLHDFGAAIGLYDRLELSYAHQQLNLGSTGAALDAAIGNFFGAPVSALPAPLQFGNDYSFKQDIIGIKLRLHGHIVYDQHTLIPEISVGLRYHHNENGATIDAIGARPDGMDYYIAASKLFVDGLFGRYTFVNLTLDVTNANQDGLLGFGGVGRNGSYAHNYRLEPGISIAQFITRRVAVGYEFRSMPQNQLVGYNGLGDAVSRTDPWQDIFVAWFINRQLSVTAAYAHLGRIASLPGQNGAYVSLTAGF
jgi:hypothetical protein